MNKTFLSVLICLLLTTFSFAQDTSEPASEVAEKSSETKTTSTETENKAKSVSQPSVSEDASKSSTKNSALIQAMTSEEASTEDDNSKELISTAVQAVKKASDESDSDKRVAIQEKQAKQDEAAAKDTSNLVATKNTNFDDVDILADNELRSYFIFVDDFNESDESIREIIEERDLARDDFLMQNIDREEFEQERILLMFKNKDDRENRRTYGVLKVTAEDFRPAVEEKGSVETLNPSSAN